MRFSVFTHADHYHKNGSLYSYGPYVREMNYWLSEFDEIEIIAPLSKDFPTAIDLPYQLDQVRFFSVPALHFKKNSPIHSILGSWKVIKSCFTRMKNSDHIHVRCPGNIGLLALIISSFFPKVPKSIKYAGNWESKSGQPISYRFQKWWLSTPFLTRNAKVLVYGNWVQQKGNIIPFFTASYSEKEIQVVDRVFQPPFRFIFCGSLVEGKNPLVSLKLIHSLLIKGVDVNFDVFGEGNQKQLLIEYVKEHSLGNRVTLHGNKTQQILIEAYKKSHFCILPSQSEGWPKAVAEGMFFGCIPVATPVSCVPWMLDYGNRGILIPDLERREESREKIRGSKLESGERNVDNQDVLKETVEKIIELIRDSEEMRRMSLAAQEWSQQFTLEKFEEEIKKLLETQ